MVNQIWKLMPRKKILAVDYDIEFFLDHGVETQVNDLCRSPLLNLIGNFSPIAYLYLFAFIESNRPADNCFHRIEQFLRFYVETEFYTPH